MTERIKSQIQAAEMCFLKSVAGVFISDKVVLHSQTSLHSTQRWGKVWLYTYTFRYRGKNAPPDLFFSKPMTLLMGCDCASENKVGGQLVSVKDLDVGKITLVLKCLNPRHQNLLFQHVGY